MNLSTCALIGDLFSFTVTFNSTGADPTTDPSTLSDSNPISGSWATNTTVTPTLVSLSKTYHHQEGETAPDPNFPHRKPRAISRGFLLLDNVDHAAEPTKKRLTCQHLSKRSPNLSR